MPPVPPPTPHRPTFFGQDAKRFERVGLRADPWSDAYTFLLEVRWTTLFGGFAIMVVLTNVLFGAGFLLSGGVANCRPGSFRDAFFFSGQTLSTQGFGQMYPSSNAAQLLVMLESMVGILQMTLVTGLFFAKFSRPLGRLLFSQHAVVTTIDGVPTLQFRAANARGNHVVSAEATLTLIRWESTKEGKTLYRMHDLPLVRSRSPAFKNTWLIMHRVTAESPLFGVTEESAKALDLELAATVIGLDGTTSQTIHASHSYVADDLRFGAHFVDMLEDLPNGRLRVDYAKFDQTRHEGELSQ